MSTFSTSAGEKGLITERRQGCKEGLEVEHNGADEWQATQGLPVDAKMHAGEREKKGLGSLVGFEMGAMRHE